MHLVNLYGCNCLYIYACMHACVYVCMFVSMYIRINIHIYIHVYIYTCIYIPYSTKLWQIWWFVTNPPKFYLPKTYYGLISPFYSSSYFFLFRGSTAFTEQILSLETVK